MVADSAVPGRWRERILGARTRAEIFIAPPGTLALSPKRHGYRADRFPPCM